MNKRIAHVCLACFYVDGMGYQENILPKKHHQQGNVVEIITSQYCFTSDYKPSTRPVGRHINENGIDVVVLPYRGNKKVSSILHYVDGLYEELVKFNPDIIFCHGLSFLSINDLCKYCKRFNVKLYCDCHADYFNTPTKGFKYYLLNKIFWPSVAKKVQRYCTKAWGVTPARCEYLKTVYRFPKDKVDLLVMGGDEDYINLKDKSILQKHIRESYKIPDDSIVIASGGKINKGKKIVELMDAIGDIEGFYLLVFGSLSDDIKEEFNHKLVQYNNVIYLGWANQEQVNNYLISADLAVFPGTHSVLWEQAVACGTPAIYKYRDMMTHVDVGGNCVFLEQSDPLSIRSAIELLINNKDKFEKMKRIAVDKGAPLFSYNNIALRAIELNI